MGSSKALAIATGIALLAGCSQNYSDKPAAEALEEENLQPVVGTGARPSETSAYREGAESGERQSLRGISVVMPQGWQRVPPASSMRVAEYLLPGAAANAADASLAVFYFGPDQGGSVEGNMARWYGQFSQPDGSSTREQARRWEKQVGGIPMTLVDISGTYSGGMGPMGQSSKPEPGYRMLGAIAESPAGYFFFKLTGPGPTIALWAEDFDWFIDTIQVE